MNSLPLLFEDLPLDGRKMVLDDILSALDADEVRELVMDTRALGLLCEAHLAGADDLDEFERELLPGDVQRLAELVDKALLARLPVITE